jgi:hypothetical protein
MILTKFDLTNKQNFLHNLIKFFSSLKTSCIVTYNLLTDFTWVAPRILTKLS